MSHKNDGGPQRSSCGQVYDLLFLLQQDVSSWLRGEGGQPLCGGRGQALVSARMVWPARPLLLETALRASHPHHFSVSHSWSSLYCYHCVLLTSSCPACCFLLGRDVHWMVLPADPLLGAVLAVGGSGNQDIVHKPERASALWKALENF